MVLQSLVITVTNMSGVCGGSIPVEGSIAIPAGDYADLMRDVDGNVVEDWSGSMVNTAEIDNGLVALTRADAVVGIKDHVVIRGQLWYLCQFENKSMLAARFVTATILETRKDLKERYWESRVLKDEMERETMKLNALVHENALMVVKR